MIGVALVGPCGGGKTSLLSVISHLLPGATPLRRPVRSDDLQRYATEPELPAAVDARPLLDHIFIERNMLSTIAPKQPHILSLDGRPFAFFDCPGDLRYSRNAARCLALCDVAIMVIDILGSGSKVRQHAAMVRAMGIKELLVYIGRCDRVISEQSDAGGIEIYRDLFLEHAEELLSPLFSSTSYFMGSTLWAMEDILSQQRQELGRESVELLLDALCQLQTPVRATDGPVRMWVQQRFNVAGQGAVVAGRLLQGTLKRGELLEFQPPGDGGVTAFSRAEVVSIKRGQEPLEQATAGDIVGVMLQHVGHWRVASSQLCTSSGQRLPSDMATRIGGRLKLLPQHQPKRSPLRSHSTAIKGVRTGYTPQFQAGTVVRDGTIVLPKGVAFLACGEAADVEVRFALPIPIPGHGKLLLRDSGQILGTLEDVRLLEDSDAWLWYQAEADQSLSHLRGLLYGRPSRALWERLLRFYQCAHVVDYEAEQATEHRRSCSEYVLQHMDGWRRDVLAAWDNTADGEGALDAHWDGLWRCTSEGDDGSTGLGQFLEIRRQQKPGLPRRYRLRDVFVRIPNDLTDLLHSVMFVRVWIRPRPFVTAWKFPKQQRRDGAQVLGWMTTSWPDDIWRIFYHQVTATGPHTLERITFVYQGPFGGEWRGVDRIVAAQQTYERIARLEQVDEGDDQ